MSNKPIAGILAELSERLQVLARREERWGRARSDWMHLMISRVVDEHLALDGSSGFREWLERKVAETSMREADRELFAEYFQRLPRSTPPLLFTTDAGQ